MAQAAWPKVRVPRTLFCRKVVLTPSQLFSPSLPQRLLPCRHLLATF